MVRVAINGFGRIGRMIFRAAYARKDINIVAVNDLGSTDALAYLLKYDSVHGEFKEDVAAGSGKMKVGSRVLSVLAQKDPSMLPWKELKVDIVLECTGLFLSEEKASMHIKAGAGKVILSAPAKDHGAIKTIVMGVNENTIDKSDKIVSNASCTTNCLAPLMKILDDAYSIQSGFMTTVHAVTSTQGLLDGINEKDYRRGRSALLNMLPTTTGAAKSIGTVLPHLDGRLDGMAVRVPLADGSLTDATVTVKKIVTSEGINMLFKKKAKEMKEIVQYTETPIVSSDIVGNSHSCIIDGTFTKANGNLIKVLAWYDNEWGYSNRMVDLVEYISRLK